MTREEFIKERADLIIDDLYSYWGVQRDNDGSYFIRTPIKELEDFLQVFSDDIDSGLELYDEDKFDDEDSPFPEDVYQEWIGEITKAYNIVVEARKEYEHE